MCERSLAINRINAAWEAPMAILGRKNFKKSHEKVCNQWELHSHQFNIFNADIESLIDVLALYQWNANFGRDFRVCILGQPFHPRFSIVHVTCLAQIGFSQTHRWSGTNYWQKLAFHTGFFPFSITYVNLLSACRTEIQFFLRTVWEDERKVKKSNEIHLHLHIYWIFYVFHGAHCSQMLSHLLHIRIFEKFIFYVLPHWVRPTQCIGCSYVN